MSVNLAAFAYLIASICFVLALRGLSHPESSRAGNVYGIAGMVIAVVTTLALPGVVSYWLIAAGVLVGGAIGTVIALRIQMTALPQLVAAFHSLVGLAAVLVAAAAFYKPQAYGIGVPGDIKLASLIEMSIGVVIGAITFTGSIVAFAKLQGLVSGNPLVFPLQHPLNALIGIVIVALTAWFAVDQTELAFGEQPADHHRRPGRLLGRDPQLHHVQGHEPLDLQRDPGRVRRRDGRSLGGHGRPDGEVRLRR
jgi:NAD(P) transhydrogenase subunit beta